MTSLASFTFTKFDVPLVSVSVAVPELTAALDETVMVSTMWRDYTWTLFAAFCLGVIGNILRIFCRSLLDLCTLLDGDPAVSHFLASCARTFSKHNQPAPLPSFLDSVLTADAGIRDNAVMRERGFPGGCGAELQVVLGGHRRPRRYVHSFVNMMCVHHAS